ncbi:hypothetical protein Tco_0197572 [Tanacetum coccineum]
MCGNKGLMYYGVAVSDGLGFVVVVVGVVVVMMTNFDESACSIVVQLGLRFGDSREGEDESLRILRGTYWDFGGVVTVGDGLFSSGFCVRGSERVTTTMTNETRAM